MTAGKNDVAIRSGSENPASMGAPFVGAFPLCREFLFGVLEGAGELVNALLHLEDAGDAGQVDAILLGHALNFLEAFHILQGVAPPASAGAPGGHQPQAVILAQRLGVHAREFGRY